MSLFFLILKVFPFFGISLIFIFMDLARTFYRKGNKTWVGMVLLGFLFFAATITWIVFRGDKNADFWFGRLNDWLHHG